MSTPAANSTNSERSGWDNISTYQFEVLDYIPGVSLVSGVARQIFGALQIAVGTIQSTIDLVDFCFHPLENTGKDDGSYMYNQGRANMVRGSVAIFPFIGNIILYSYDHSRYAKSGDKIDWKYVR